MTVKFSSILTQIIRDLHFLSANHHPNLNLSKLLFGRLVVIVVCGGFIFDLASAQPSSGSATTFEVEGVAFPCQGCSRDTHGSCEISVKGGRVLLPCESAFEALLLTELDKGSPTPTVAIAQLRRKLAESSLEPAIALAVVKLLGSTATGREAMIADAELLVRQHPESLYQFLSSAPDDQALLQALWKVPRQEGSAEEEQLMALIVTKAKGLGFSEILAELGGLNIAVDIAQLQRLAGQLTDQKGELKGKFEKLISQLQTCQRMLELEERDLACRSRDLDTLDEAERVYLERIKVQHVLGLIEQGNLKPGEILSRVELINFREFSTPGVIGAVRVALGQLTPESGYLVEEIGKRHQILITELARRDPGVSQAAERIFSVSGIKPAKAAPASFTTWFAALAGLLAAGTALIIWRRRSAKANLQKRNAVESPDVKQLMKLEELNELRKLLRGFGLADHVSEEELTKEYRKKAKAIHPDSGAGNHEEFVKLQRDYERARELLQKRKPVYRSPIVRSASPE